MDKLKNTSSLIASEIVIEDIRSILPKTDGIQILERLKYLHTVVNTMTKKPLLKATQQPILSDPE